MTQAGFSHVRVRTPPNAGALPLLADLRLADCAQRAAVFGWQTSGYFEGGSNVTLRGSAALNG
jgi:hypothetical protein